MVVKALGHRLPSPKGAIYRYMGRMYNVEMYRVLGLGPKLRSCPHPLTIHIRGQRKRVRVWDLGFRAQGWIRPSPINSLYWGP